MDVRCEQCGTIYEFEDDRVSNRGITVKCTSCGFIFKVFKKKAVTAQMATTDPKKPAKPAASSGEKKGPDKRWLIRKPSGEVFRFRELTTLQQWIVEQKVSREDEISRTGKVWERLGAIKELEPFFRVVDKARAADKAAAADTVPPNKGASAPGPAVKTERPEATASPRADLLSKAKPEPTGAPAPAIEDRSAPFTMGAGAPEAAAEPSFAKRPLELSAAPNERQAAWEESGAAAERERVTDTEVVELHQDTEDSRGSHVTKTVVVVVLGIVVGFGGFMAFTKWDRIKALFSGSRRPTEGAYYKGRTLFRLDTEASFGRALKQLEQIYRSRSKDVSTTERANARAAQAEIYAAWAQYHADDAKEYRHEATLLEKGSSSAPQIEALRTRATQAEAAARDKAQRALNYARHAHGMHQNLQTARALAESSRVAKRPVEEITRLIAKARRFGANDPELHYTEAMVSYDQDKLQQAQKQLRMTIELSNQKTGKPFFRAQMRLALVYYQRGLRREARTVLETITSRNPGHARAQRLLDKIKAGSMAVAIKPATQPDAGTPPADPAMDQDMDDGMTPGPGSSKGEPHGDYDTLVRRAERYAYGGNQTKAMALYRKALEKRANGVEALTGLGYGFLDLRRSGEAIRYFRRALRVSGAYGEALIGLAEAYQRSRNLRQALAYYKRYVRHHPSGRRAVLAKQNIREIQDKLGAGATMAPPDVGQPGPREGNPRPGMPSTSPQPDMTSPSAMIRESPPTRRPPIVREPPPTMGLGE